ncbi:MAG TPA: hypothetical protein VJN96_23505 [Vicinamibacterales bacterium]|nr:hypothetical protein [Vicinamibacterales bacterium]
MSRRAALAVAAVAFAVVATANSGGYRFGVSDQAYYEPAVAKGVDAALFPRDSALLDVQSRFLGSVHLLAALSRATGTGLPALFLAAYVMTLAGLFAASVVLARRLSMSWWAIAAFLLLLTLRHRIAKTGANSLEGYMHPRMIAFVCGVAASAAIGKARMGWAAMWTALAVFMHPTTGVWFAVMSIAGFAAARPEWRRTIASACAVAGGVGFALLEAGPLAGRLRVMDADWLAVLADKDYLFPTAWPAYAWLLNLAYPVILVLVYRQRRARGVTAPGEFALVAGLVALVGVFLISVPFTAARLALAVQLQINRVFWLTDFFTMIYVAWWLIDRAPDARRRIVIVGLIAALAVGRGAYVLRVEADRTLVQASLPDTPWIGALAWLRTQPASWFVLADPGHAWKYGVSVRVGAHRDTFLELGKDSSMAMYDRDVAMRVKERSAALANFDDLDAAGFRALAARFGIDVLVDRRTRALALPVLHQNADFVVYDLR